jgi:hypothetical protein
VTYVQLVILQQVAERVQVIVKNEDEDLYLVKEADFIGTRAMVTNCPDYNSQPTFTVKLALINEIAIRAIKLKQGAVGYTAAQLRFEFGDTTVF